MNKEKFIQQVEENIKELSLEEMKSLIIELGKKIPNSSYQMLLCLIKKYNGNLDEDYAALDKMKKEIYSDFKKIENGDICLRCYSYETGSYSYYDADLDYEYWLTSELDKVLNKVYDYIKNSVLHKQYSDAIEIIDLFLFQEYTCEEVGNPEYDDSDTIYDSYEKDISEFKNLLNFDLNELLLYAIYSIIMGNFDNKNERILKYTKYGNINIMQVKNIGIEEINNFDKFYDEWIKFLEKDK